MYILVFSFVQTRKIDVSSSPLTVHGYTKVERTTCTSMTSPQNFSQDLFRCETPPMDVGHMGTPPMDVGHVGTPPMDVGHVGTPPMDVGHVGTPPMDVGRVGTPPMGVGHVGTPPMGVGGVYHVAEKVSISGEGLIDENPFLCVCQSPDSNPCNLTDRPATSLLAGVEYLEKSTFTYASCSNLVKLKGDTRCKQQSHCDTPAEDLQVYGSSETLYQHPLPDGDSTTVEMYTNSPPPNMPRHSVSEKPSLSVNDQSSSQRSHSVLPKKRRARSRGLTRKKYCHSQEKGILVEDVCKPEKEVNDVHDTNPTSCLVMYKDNGSICIDEKGQFKNMPQPEESTQSGDPCKPQAVLFLPPTGVNPPLLPVSVTDNITETPFKARSGAPKMHTKVSRRSVPFKAPRKVEDVSAKEEMTFRRKLLRGFGIELDVTGDEQKPLSGSPVPCLFQTASGKSLEPSVKALTNARQLLQTVNDEMSSNDSIPLKEKCSLLHVLDDGNQRCPVGFSTASGKEIRTSEESMKKAALMLAGDSSMTVQTLKNNSLPDPCRDGYNVDEGVEKNLAKSMSGACGEQDRTTVGFSTAGGRALTVTASAMQLGRSVIDQCRVPTGPIGISDDSGRIVAGSSTAGRKLTVSVDSVQHSRYVLKDLEMGGDLSDGTVEGEMCDVVEGEWSDRANGYLPVKTGESLDFESFAVFTQFPPPVSALLGTALNMDNTSCNKQDQVSG